MQEIRRVAVADPPSNLIGSGRQEMVERAALPCGCSLAGARSAVLDDGVLLDAVVAPTERPALVDRVEGIDEDQRT